MKCFVVNFSFINVNFFSALYSLAVIWPGCGLWWLDTTVCLWMCKCLS